MTEVTRELVTAIIVGWGGVTILYWGVGLFARALRKMLNK